jgi:predicted transcriptional regulator/transcriptional regulator with XRE-family HTH domain
MASNAYLGNKIRRLRKEGGMTQVQLAGRLSISPSYLNLIERNQRALTVPLLLKLAEIFQLDLRTFSEDDEARLVADLQEAFSDPIFAAHRLRDADLRELLGASAVAARAVLELYRAYRRARDDAQSLAARLSDGEVVYGAETHRQPTDEVSDFLQHHDNHFQELETAAVELWKTAEIVPTDIRGCLGRHLLGVHGIGVEIATSEALAGAVRRFSPRERKLILSEALPSYSVAFQLAHQIALFELQPVLDRLMEDAELTSADSRRLCRIALASYFAGAVLMPYDRFLERAKAVRYDVELLEHRFRVSFEQVCHRLTTLNAPGNAGVPFHLVRVDIAGNISKRYSGSGMRFARYSGGCSLWNVHAAFLTPGLIRTQLSEMPDGKRYFSIARTMRKAGGGHQVRQARYAIELGCEAKFAKELVYADGVDLDSAAVPIGVSCRLCERTDCRQRAFPPMHHRLEVDENVRGLSFYYSPPSESRDST